MSKNESIKAKGNKPLPGVIYDDRPFPHDLDAEKAILAAMLLEPDYCIDLCVEKLGTIDVFYHQGHQKIYQCILELHNQEASGIDFITVTNALSQKGILEETGGEIYLTEIENSIATTANLESWCQIVLDDYLLRKMITICHTATNDCYEARENTQDLLNNIENDIFKIRESQLESEIVEIKDLAKPSFQHILDIYHKKVEPGIPTKFADLDKKIIGLKPGEMFVLGARPSIGKTAFALNVIRNIALDGNKPRPVALFSLEMTDQQIAIRLLCTEANVSIQDVYTKSIKPADLNRFTPAADAFMNAKIYIDPTPGLQIGHLRAKAKRLKYKHDIQLIVIDYLQLMQPDRNSDSRQQEVSSISHGIKSLAKEMNIPILVLAQLNREIEKGTGKIRPKLSHLRESGAIEQDADVVAFLHRDRDQQKEATASAQVEGLDAEIIVEKNRNGETGIIKLLFFPKRMLFNDKKHIYKKEDRPRQKNPV